MLKFANAREMRLCGALGCGICLLALALALAGCDLDGSGGDSSDTADSAVDTGTEAEGDSGYEGQIDWDISTADELVAWNELAQKYPFINCTIKADIDLSNAVWAWTPVGSSDNPYTGAFDGGGFAITGLAVESSDGYIGLFGYIGESGQVASLTLEGLSVSGAQNVGGIAGANSGTIKGCTVSGGTVSGSGSRIGGIAGVNSGTIEDCENSSAVSSASGSASAVGGIAGRNNGGTIEGCANKGKVAGTDGVGGITSINSESGTVKGCANEGDVEGRQRVGGIAGVNSGAVEDCENSGKVAATVDNVGGIVGYNNSGATVTGCGNTGAVSCGETDAAYIGDVAGRNEGAIASCTYAGGSGNDAIGGGDGTSEDVTAV